MLMSTLLAVRTSGVQGSWNTCLPCSVGMARDDSCVRGSCSECMQTVLNRQCVRSDNHGPYGTHATVCTVFWLSRLVLGPSHRFFHKVVACRRTADVPNEESDADMCEHEYSDAHSDAEFSGGDDDNTN